MVEGLISPIFNKANYLDYVDSHHAAKYFGADFISDDERTQFSAWFAGVNDKLFNNREELLAYCMVNVFVLIQVGCVLGNLFMKFVKMSPFREAIKISSNCNKVFRTMFLKPDSVSIIARGGYGVVDR